MNHEAIYEFNPQAKLIRNMHYENHKKLLDDIKHRDNQFRIDKSQVFLKKNNKQHEYSLPRSISLNKNPMSLDNDIINRRIKAQDPSILYVQMKDEFKQHKKMLKNIKRVKSIKKEKSKKHKGKSQKNKIFLPPILPRRFNDEYAMWNINSLPPLERLV